MTQPSTRATARTFTAHHIDRECGVVVHVQDYAVTIARTARGLIATVDGVQVPVLEADRILRTAARVEVMSEVLEAAPIGKPAACNLHKELGALGYRSHYALAAEVLGKPVPSLAALSAEDAATVRQYAYGQLGRVA
ncbi:hypothetical protein [Deinococcus humi]|uniref:Uncharacterized protein n=1 Tax=Deinococcus humi TaxID=662880 RepID=A0A7W8JQH1_9DEIO|nr:hypothetical protein [Deinococcus humi]MBB5361326.1 hypothetical protein [Deinococcus humi]GGO19492.1 hypothetical protein GCM10008949_03910 [Deinococcus humi]